MQRGTLASLVKTVVISLGFKTPIRRIRINLPSVVLSTEIKFANWGASLFCKAGVHKFLKFCNDALDKLLARPWHGNQVTIIGLIKRSCA